MDNKIEKQDNINQKSLNISTESDFFKLKNSLEDIVNALTKKARGYDSKEVVEEFAFDENSDERIVKKKITTKVVPPDVSAVKVLLELENNLHSQNFEQLTDQEIDQKIDEILNTLKETDNE